MGSVVLGASLLFTAGAHVEAQEHDPLRAIHAVLSKGRIQAKRLLLLPPGALPEEDYAKRVDSTLLAALQKEAVEQEIMDTREQRYMLSRKEDFLYDMKLLQRRREDLVNAPRLVEGNHLPPSAVISDMLAFNRRYKETLEKRQSINLARWWDWQEVIQENDRRYKVWDTVRDARCEYYYITVRRQALERLLKKLGPKKFADGDLPTVVPEHSFTPIDK
jgi:hypothetical protein